MTIQIEIDERVAEALMDRFGTRDFSEIAEMAINAKADQLGIFESIPTQSVRAEPIGVLRIPAIPE